MANLKYWLWLANRKGLSGDGAVRVLNYFGSPETAYFSDPEAYKMVGGLSEANIRALMDKSLDQANKILDDCDRGNINMLTMQDAAYPERLAAIHHPPMVLYWKGRPVAFDEEVSLAVVGTRKATAYGLQTARELAAELARRGAVIVSGLAEGIDAAAIEGGLRGGGPVVSVLGGGVDVIYPRENRRLYEDLSVIGTLISERPPGAEPLATYFPVRNRIISGLSLGVVAVESRKSGGTLYTVEHALEQGREVFAVPGRIDSAESEGTNLLIQEGAAKLILNVDDILCEFEARYPHKLRRPNVGTIPQRAEPVEQKNHPPAEISVDTDAHVSYIDWKDCQQKLTDDQKDVMLLLNERAYRVDDLVEATQIPVRRVQSALTILQVQGYVRETSGKRFEIISRLKME